jgi:hypothetical protein
MESETSKRFLPGERVILSASGECGVVVHTWVSDELGGLDDCYVAFFGRDFPDQGAKPRQIPYVLRYAATSLRRAPGPQAVERADVERLLGSELARITEPPLLEALRAHLVRPTCQLRWWNYGATSQRFPCWLVAEIAESRTGISYCEHGHGPGYPWGLVDLDDDALGMDASWHINLEHAFRNSPPWAGRNPPDYEVP